MSNVIQLVSDDKCYVCGCEVNKSFLQKWNGEEVCKLCIEELHEEAEHLHVSWE